MLWDELVVLMHSDRGGIPSPHRRPLAAGRECQSPLARRRRRQGHVPQDRRVRPTSAGRHSALVVVLGCNRRRRVWGGKSPSETKPCDLEVDGEGVL